MACGPPKKVKLARKNIEWVAQVSKARPGPPTQRLEVADFCPVTRVGGTKHRISPEDGVSGIPVPGQRN